MNMETNAMARNRSTDVAGKPFAQTTVGAVWNKAVIAPGFDPDKLSESY